MTLELLRVLTPYILGFLTLAWTLIVFVSHKTFATKKEVSEVKERQNELERKHMELDKKVDNLPGHEDFSNLQISIEKLHGEFKAIPPQLNQLHKMIDLLLENELKERP